MRLFFWSLLLSSISAIAGTEVSAIKSWKRFQSNVGYEFKYPDCWQVSVDDPDEEGPIEGAKVIAVRETPACARPRFSRSASNGIGFSGGMGQKKSVEDAIREVEKLTRFSGNNIASKQWLVFKRFKLGSSDTTAWVQVFTDSVRWQMTVYCPDLWISIGGPTMDKANVDKSVYEKFKKCDLALPEPEKTILESVRCIAAKQK